MDVMLSFVKQVFSHVSDQFSDPPRRTERGSISNISSPVLVALWKTGGRKCSMGAKQTIDFKVADLSRCKELVGKIWFRFEEKSK